MIRKDQIDMAKGKDVTVYTQYEVKANHKLKIIKISTVPPEGYVATISDDLKLAREIPLRGTDGD